MNASPSDYEILASLKAGIEGTGIGGVVRTDAAFNLGPEGYADQVRDPATGLVDGVLMHIGPATRERKPDGIHKVRIFLVDFLVANQDPLPSGPGAGLSPWVYLEQKIQAFSEWLGANPRLGFGANQGSYPNAIVRHQELQEPIGQFPVQRNIDQVLNAPAQLPVLIARC